MTDTLIPTDSVSPTIETDVADSNIDTPSNGETTPSNSNVAPDIDSAPEGEDTSVNASGELTSLQKEIAELKRKDSDRERRQYETNRKKVSANPDNILEIYEQNPSQANAIVKSLWSEQGYNNVDDLLEAAKNKEEEAKIDDPEVLKIKREKDTLRKEVDELKSNAASVVEKEQLNEIYQKYPNLHPSNDSEDSNWKAFKGEFDILDSSRLGTMERAAKAYKLAFGDIDEDETRALQKSLGNLPSGGTVPKTDSGIKVSADSLRASERTGVDASLIEKHKDFWG